MTSGKKSPIQSAVPTQAASGQSFSGRRSHGMLHSMQYDCDQSETQDSQVFVLVHGAWHGGWCWQRVAAHLRSKGHTVYTPTLTGLGERSHLLRPDISLETFVDDIANLIRWEQLCKVNLVGHSFGGLVISGVADVLPKQIQQLIYLDAFILPSGISTFDTLPEDLVNKMRESAQGHGVAAVPAPPPQALGLHDPNDLRFVADRLTPQPLSTYDSALNLQNPTIGNHLPCTYIACTEPAFRAVSASRQWAQDQKNWEIREFNSGHLPMVSAPEPLAKLLHELLG